MDTLTKSITQLYEMSKRDLGTRIQRLRGVLGSGWKYIPSVKSFRIELGRLNMLLESIGFKRRMGNRFIFVPNENKRMNRYLKYNMMRLSKMRNKEMAGKYWLIAWLLMKRSVSFRVSAINNRLPKWYKTMPLSYVMNINGKVQKIFDQRIDNLEFKRVLIPKNDLLWNEVGGNQEEYEKRGGKMRPLGVPREAWRISLHMWSNFLTFFLENVISENQHAYRPRRGTLTAWTSLVTKLKKYPYIYEIDLRKCFDSIRNENVSRKLLELGVPNPFVNYLENLNRSIPRMDQDPDIKGEPTERWSTVLHEWREDEYLDPSLVISRIKGNLRDTPQYPYNGVPEGNKEEIEVILEEDGITIEEFIEMQWAMTDNTKNEPIETGPAHTGLPQGANTSPILTALVLDDFTRQYESVFYADDGIFFSKKPMKIEDDPGKGIFLNTEKSRPIRENYVWQNEIKFLGLRYNPWTDELSGNTRLGSTLKFSPEAEKIHEILKDVKAHSWSQGETKWERLFKSTVGGFVVSKLYNATWEELEYIVKYCPEGVKGSWLDLKDQLDNYETTSSTACAALSYILKSSDNVARPKGEKEYSSLETTKKPKVIFVKGKGGKKQFIRPGWNKKNKETEKDSAANTDSPQGGNVQ